MEETNQNSSIIALKIIMFLSLILVGMDLLEVYFSYVSLKTFSIEFNDIIFEECIKYHLFTQMVFTIFATMAGLSAFIMSAGILINENFFGFTALETFLNLNFTIFGPYLFIMSIFGFTYYDKILYNCSKEDFSIKHLNFSTLLAVIICFFISFFITFVYSFFEGYHIMVGSIRLNRHGYRFIGKLFWKYVFYRRRDEVERSNNPIDQQFNVLYNPNLHHQLYEERNNQISINNNLNNNRNNLENEIEMTNIDNSRNQENNILIINENNLEEPLNGIINMNNQIEDLSKINFNDINRINMSNRTNKNILFKENYK